MEFIKKAFPKSTWLCTKYQLVLVSCNLVANIFQVIFFGPGSLAGTWQDNYMETVAIQQWYLYLILCNIITLRLC